MTPHERHSPTVPTPDAPCENRILRLPVPQLPDPAGRLLRCQGLAPSAACETPPWTEQTTEVRSPVVLTTW